MIIKYTPVFRERCIEIFKSNLPKFFAPEELQLFEDFLDHHTEDNYYVVNDAGHIKPSIPLYAKKDFRLNRNRIVISGIKGCILVIEGL